MGYDFQTMGKEYYSDVDERNTDNEWTMKAVNIEISAAAKMDEQTAHIHPDDDPAEVAELLLDELGFLTQSYNLTNTISEE